MTGEAERLGRGIQWRDLSLGARYISGGRTISDADIAAFVNHMGMTENPFPSAGNRHAEATIKKIPAPGTLVLSVAEALAFDATAQEAGLAFLGISSLDIRSPVLAGDTIEVEIEILEMRQDGHEDRGMVLTRNTVFNQSGEVVMVYDPLRLMRGKPV